MPVRGRCSETRHANGGSGGRGVSSARSLTLIDIDAHFLPDEWTNPLFWLGLLVNTVQALVPLPDAVFGGAAGILAL